MVKSVQTTALLLFALSGCSRDFGQKFDVSGASNIHVGVSDMEAVQRYLGPPRQQSKAYGAEVWSYQYTHVDVAPTAIAFIPIYGTMLQGAYKSNTSSQSVSVIFRGNIVESCTLIVSSGKSSDAGVASLGLSGVNSSETRNCDGSPNAPQPGGAMVGPYPGRVSSPK